MIEDPVKVFEKLQILKASEVKIGAYTYFMSARIRVKTSIGRFCSIARDIVIGEPNHPLNWLSTSPIQYKIDNKWDKHKSLLDFKLIEIPRESNKVLFGSSCSIGNDVWIGDRVTILRDVKISDGAVIASGAVVTKDVPPYAIVGGVPAKVIRYRFDEETIKKLLSLKWWDFDVKFLSGLPFDDIHECIKKLEELKASNSNIYKKTEYIEIVN